MDTRPSIYKEDELDKIGRYLFTQQFADNLFLILKSVNANNTDGTEESKEAVEDLVEELIKHDLEL